MIWTVIRYKDKKPFVHTFHASNGQKEAFQDAQKVFPGIKVVAIVAGNHTSSVYIKED